MHVLIKPIYPYVEIDINSLDYGMLIIRVLIVIIETKVNF